ncbi:hypothetical protein NDU88_003109 [Pleurodeles waltl]|uniref:Uncharacterized protein n=1 Tax=Pleurodeles waltl TaxID=8319 RepID=A0AAV7T4H5_PLEWA|nr:hypothetical protein NDU88_003109 [Pleurodeles waltl]
MQSCTAGMHGDVQLDSTLIRIFSVFSLRVQRERHNFEEVKNALQAKEIQYMMFYPTRLRVVVNGKTWHFTSLEEVWDWLERWQVVGFKDAGEQRPPRPKGTAEVLGQAEVSLESSQTQDLPKDT